MNGDPAVEPVAARIGLPNSRLISWSKSGYHRAHPGNFVLFNCSIADDAGKRLWWGDLDLTREEEMLIELARALDRRLHILFESDTWAEPMPIEHAAVVFQPDGGVVLTYRWGIRRDAAGRIARPESASAQG
jgi:hypothetical protein